MASTWLGCRQHLGERWEGGFDRDLSQEADAMDAKYLVNISLAQVYFDADFNKCAPPGSQPGDLTMIRHYVQMANNGVLRHEWDIGLGEYSVAQREKAELYVAIS